MINKQADKDAAKIAASYINSTQRHVFLTGKAGTGKTTFLKEIVNITHKSAIVAAPTGIAAINAGGVTLHSLFQLPLGIFLPSNRNLDESELEVEIQTPSSIMKNLRLNKIKRRMIQEMELLIIDEVSMLRADMADAIDTVLRTVRRRRNIPFGGVQLLLIGDMQQLPPVVRQKEWNYLNPYYKSMYFFDARAFSKNKPVFIELENIYRQQDPVFIRILNNLRDDKLKNEDIEILNKHHYPSLSNEQKEGAVFLTTHNYQADELNFKKLKALPGKSYSFEASVIGDFPDRTYPVEYMLELKEGAQIMFVKNDYSGEQRYFNGKIGKIHSLNQEEIVVEFIDENEFVEIEPYTWENKRYTLNKDTNEIEEKIIGSFEQFPIKLAWAITVHKSQGLTFDKAIIDVSQAFAPGQAYVALSRLRSLDGLMLSQPISQNKLITDKILADFSSQKTNTEQLKTDLKEEAFRYTKDFLLSAYDFEDIVYRLRHHIESYNKQETRSEKQKKKSWASSLLVDIEELKNTGNAFQNQIIKTIRDKEGTNLQYLKERVQAAKTYFESAIKKHKENVLNKRQELSEIKGTKLFRNELEDIEGWFMSKLKQFLKSELLVISFIDNIEPDNDVLESKLNELYTESISQEQKTSKKKKTGKRKKENSRIPTTEISHQLYKEGKSISEIAAQRGMAVSTIEGHLSKCVSMSMIPVSEFVNQDCINEVVKAYNSIKTNKLTDIRNHLNKKYSFSEIRFALAGHFSESK